MLSIRFSRTGKKKQPYYRVIVTEKTRDPWGKFLEILGNYNPRSKEAELKADRINYWIGKGAQPTDTVKNLLISKEVIKGEKVRASKSKPGKKKAMQIEADKKAKEAAAAAEAMAAKEEVKAKAEEAEAAKAEVPAEAAPEAPAEVAPATDEVAAVEEEKAE